ncbi:hypothetical protein [Alicyclobacillus sp. SP_1]|uniref:hypothetical protein n=1 Tax=Alicyclobacillus sp. SP_1 TaxID=2942475 RepID=UPI002157E5FE|nr:hypothetical protein [Alicyclobacillus sp. SP_1]
METEILNENWLTRFAVSANAGPADQRIEETASTYWDWIAARKQTLTLKLAFVVVDAEENVQRAGLFDIVRGDIVRVQPISTSELHAADLVLGGTAEDWQELSDGPRTISQNIMYRRLRLYRGDLHLFFRNIYYFVEMVRAGLRLYSAV